jgi:prepilin-type N-terminal cleavage/methylation domain-containing protein
MRRRRGFSLMEMLVVIAVIAVLAALLIPAIGGIKRRNAAKATDALLQQVGLALEAYKGDFGVYPPPRLRRLGQTGSNGQNEGVECLVLALTTTARSGPYLLDLEEGRLGDRDGDGLQELIDHSGNPIAYMNEATYDGGEAVTLGEGGGLTKVAAAKEDSGQYRGLLTWQLWGAGPDAEAGTEDDLRRWGE